MTSVTRTKLRLPSLDAAFVERPKLVRLLNQGLQRCLTLVSAPAGYGKTTTTAIWAHTLGDMPVAWYALGEEDDDFSTFFTRLVAAIELVLPGSLASVPTGLALEDIQPRQLAHTLAEAFVGLPRELVVVLDDYHVITQPDISSVIAHCIQYAGKVHLVITSRFDPPLPIARLRVLQQVTEVRVADLRLDEAEAAALLTLSLAEPPSVELLSILQERTEGWAAGLRLAALALQQDDPDMFLANFQRHASVQVSDYLIDEVLDHTQAELRDFLLMTSLVARFNAELASIVTQFDVADCRRILDQLRRQNLFLVTLDQGRTWFRYHRQFGSMLVDRAASHFSAQRVADIRRSAAAWLVAQGYVEEALAEYLAGRNWEKAADLIEADRHRLQNREEWHLLWHRVAQLPEDVVASRPGLLLAQAWTLQLQSRYTPIPALLQQVAALLAADPPPPSTEPLAILAGEIHALRGSWIFAALSLEQRRTESEQALQLLMPVARYAWVRGFAYIGLARVLIAQGERNAAYSLIRSEIDGADLGATPYLARLHHALANVVYLDGSLAELERIGDRYLQLALEAEMPVAVAWARFTLGWSLYQRGNASAALPHLLLVYERRHQIHLDNALVALPPLIAAAAEMGQLAEVINVIDQVRRDALKRDNFAIADQVSAYAALAALYLEHDEAALAWAAEFVDIEARPRSGQPEVPVPPVSSAIFAKIALKLGPDKLVRHAIHLLQMAVEGSQARGRMGELVEWTTLLACCCWRLDQRVAALIWLRQALELGWPRGFRTVYFEQADQVAPMLNMMLRRDNCVATAAQLLAEIGSRTARPPAYQSGALTTPIAQFGLTEREMEVLALLAEHLTNPEIAQRLVVSPLTVRNHLSNIYQKLNVSTRKQALEQAKALHLLP